MRTDSPPTVAAAPRSRRWAVGAAVGLFAVSVAATAYSWPRPNSPVVTVTNRTDDNDLDGPMTVPDPGYVGIEVCAKCHAKRVTEFRATKHFIACREPEAGKMPPSFAPGKGAFTFGDPPVRFENTQNGNEFFQTNVRKTPAGEKRYDAKIGLIYGSSGRADEIYFTWHGDQLYELPVTWLYPLGKWGSSPFNPLGNEDLSRRTTTRCLECHNTWIDRKSVV